MKVCHCVWLSTPACFSDRLSGCATLPTLVSSLMQTMKLDLCSLASVRQFAEELNSQEEYIDCFIHNAGLFDMVSGVSQQSVRLCCVCVSMPVPVCVCACVCLCRVPVCLSVGLAG